MSLNRTIEPLTAGDETLRGALKDAHLPSLLPALAALSGDLSLLREDLLPNASFSAGEQGGLTVDQQETARLLAFEALKRYRDSGCRPGARPSEEALRRMMDYLTGGTITDEYIPLLLEELAYPEQDARAPRWRREDIDGKRPLLVAIVGAGMSGILAAFRLKQAGVPFVVLEKNTEVGGTWWENTYPGARVDSPEPRL